MDGVSIAQEEQRQYKSLKSELARLSGLIKTAEGRLAAMTIDEAEEQRLTASLVTLRRQHQELTDSVRALSGQKIAGDRELARAETAAKKAKEKYEQYSGLSETVKNKLDDSRNRLEHVRKDTAAAIASARVAAAQKVADIRKSVESAKAELKVVVNEIAAAKKELAGMAANRAKNNVLAAGIPGKERTSAKLDEDIAAKERELAEKTSKVVLVDEVIAGKWDAFQKKCVTRETSIALATKDIEDREGRVSFAKENLRSKAALLRGAKQDLEQFHGKQLRHIVIVADEDIDAI